MHGGALETANNDRFMHRKKPPGSVADEPARFVKAILVYIDISPGSIPVYGPAEIPFDRASKVRHQKPSRTFFSLKEKTIECSC
jgi:hypothetical protein